MDEMMKSIKQDLDEEITPVELINPMLEMNMGLGGKGDSNAYKTYGSADGDKEFTMQSHDIELITRPDPSTYHSGFG